MSVAAIPAPCADMGYLEEDVGLPSELALHINHAIERRNGNRRQKV